jgi:hypothetical protein
MEEMSKKTKRLEKENLTLSRKHEATNQNILKMAEERTKNHREMELLRKKSEHLEKLCRGMQAQGRGQITLPEQENDEDGTESEYDEDDYEDEGSEEYDDDTEEEHIERPPFGPVPPPPPPPQALANGTVNGKSRHMGQLNGIKA